MGQNQLKKRQHYVHKAYLNPWCFSGDNVWELKKPNTIFPVSITNTMVQRFFNEIEATNQQEREFILSLLDFTDDFVSRRKIDSIVDVLYGELFFNSIKNSREVYINAIDYLIWVSSVLEYYDSCYDCIKNDNQIQEILLILKKQMVEEYLGGIEISGYSVIKSVLAGQRIINTPDYENMIYYCGIAYARTQDSRKRLNAVKSTMIDLTRIQSILQFVIGMRLGHEMIARGSAITVIKNSTSVHFITGSQPCVNMFAEPMREVHDIQLYFPISPTVALLIGEAKKDMVSEYEITELPEIEKYNNKLSSFSSSLFSDDKELLKKYIIDCKR